MYSVLTNLGLPEQTENEAQYLLTHAQVVQVQFVMHRTVVQIQQAQREKLQSFIDIQKAGTAQRERHQERLDRMAPGNLQEKKLWLWMDNLKHNTTKKTPVPVQ